MIRPATKDEIDTLTRVARKKMRHVAEDLYAEPRYTRSLEVQLQAIEALGDERSYNASDLDGLTWTREQMERQS